MNISGVDSANPPNQSSLVHRFEISIILLYGLAISLPVSIAASHIALGGLFLFLGYRYLIKPEEFIQTPLDRAILLYLSVVFISALLGVKPGRSLIHMAGMWHILLCWIVVNLIPNQNLARRLIFVMIGVGSLNALYGIVQHLIGGLDLLAFGRPPRILYNANKDIVRANGVFDHYMTFSGQMLLLGALGSGLVLYWARGKSFWVLGVATLAFMGGVIASWTRNAWLGLLAAILVIGGLKNKAALLVTAAVLSVSILSLLIMNPSIRGQAMSMTAIKSDDSITDRFKTWETALEMIKYRPIFGVGTSNFQSEMDLYREHYGARLHSHAHNTLLQVTAENGVIGLVAYVYLWFVFFREMLRGLKNRPDPFNRGVIVGVIGAITGFHVAGLFEYNLGDSEVSIMMWFMVGLGLAACAGRFGNQSPLQPQSV